MTFDPSPICEFIGALLYAVTAMFFVISIACGTRVRN